MNRRPAAARRVSVARRTILGQLTVFVLVWLGVLALGTAPPLLDALAAMGLPADLWTAAAVLAAAVIGVLAVQRVLGGPSLTDLGVTRRPGWLADLALGLALGPVLFGSGLAIAAGLGLAHVTAGRPEAAALLGTLLALTCVAAGEELFMRGVMLQQVARGWGVPGGLAVSSGLFGLFHLPNLFATEVGPTVQLIAVVVLVLLGLVLAYGYLVTRALWLPTALHLSWNVAQGPLYGFPISGRPSEGLLDPVVAGPAWVMGGAFGPEGGLVGLVAIALATAALGAYGRRRGAQALRRPPAPDPSPRP
jgi:uncharacterized protein